MQKALLVFTFFQLIGLYLFTQGYLLSRIELPNIAKTDFKHTKRFNRLCIILIDALRYDFIAPADGNAVFENKVPVIRNKLYMEPEHSLLLRGMSDPPTTTLQRLVAIVTGTLPTLVDAGRNFASSALLEDNLLLKLKSSNITEQRMLAFGDDTWERLFPNMFDKSVFFPSFDVWDLDSVDNGVKKHLFPAVSKDFKVLIAHFLGVDHVGHRYGPGHAAMGVKLTEMNAVLSELFEKVQNDTLVMIIGDHGMDRKGDHGGDSFEEMNAGLFFYSKSPLFKADRISIARKIVEEMTKYENYEDFSVFNGARTVPQIDIVSTVCYLLGVDVPFGNLGMGVTELLSWDDKAMIDTIRDNAYQVSRYLAVYGETRSDIKSSFTEISNLLVEAEAAYNLMDDNLDTESAIKIYVLYARYLRQVLLKARKIWSQFEYVLISMGILICIANCVAVSLFLIFGRYYSLLAVISGGLLSFLGLVRPVSLIMYPKTVDNSMLTLTTRHEVAFFFALGYLICTIYLNRGDINLKSLQQNSMIINITATIVYTIIPGSDSFLIFEDYVLFHFLQFYHLIELFYRSKAKSKLYFVETLILMIILRFNFAITVCRPDQGPVCRVTFYSDPQSSVSPWWGPILSYLLGLLCWFYISHCKVYEIKNGWFLASIFSSLGYWTVSTWEAQAYISSGLSSVLNPIFLAVYSLCSFRLLSSTKKESLTVSIYAILLLFQKPMGQVSLHLLMLYVLMRKFQIKRNSKEFDVDIWLYLGLAGFFSTGHQNQLASVQYDTGFIGLQKASMVLSPIYIWLNTVSAPLLFSTIPISDIQFNNRLAALILSTTSVTAFTGHFARHSQAFRVWGPKFLFYLSNSAAIFLGMMIEAAVPSKIITKKHKDS